LQTNFIGVKKAHSGVYKLSIIGLFLIYFSNNQLIAQVSIATARTQPLGSTVTVRGVVTNGSELGIIRYLQDATAGIGLYDNANTAGLQRGDSVEVTGVLFDFNGLLEISPITSINLISSGNNLPNTQTTTIPSLGESLEGELVKINNVSFVNAGATFSGNQSYGFTSGVQQATIYVRTGSPLIGQLIPFGAVNLTGVCSQFNSIYQVLARDTADFELQPGINIVSSIGINNITQTSVDLTWLTNIEGTTEVAYGLTPSLELGLLSAPTPVINHTFTLNNLQAGQVYYFQAFSFGNGTLATGPVMVFGTESNSSGSITAYFNHPVDTTDAPQFAANFLNQAIDDTLIAYIDRATESIDFTMYDFIGDSISNVAEALNAAHNRGVRVRMITDGSYEAENEGLVDLIPAIQRITSPTSDAYTIMHNKFVVIDADATDPLMPMVWTGSTNLSGRQVNRDPNNVIIIQDQTLARTYKLEFEEMWGSSGDEPDTNVSKFGSFKTDNTPHQFRIGGKQVECYFSPSDNTNQKLIEFINSADDSLHFAAMLITRFDLYNAINARIDSGVVVKGIINSDTSTTVYDDLSLAMGNNLVINPITSEIMHHKFAISDVGSNSDAAVWTGSHNWSTNANTRNDENTVVVHDAELAEVYYRAYLAMFTEPAVEDTSDTTSTSINRFEQTQHQLNSTLLQSGSDLRIIPAYSGKFQCMLMDAAGRILAVSNVHATEGNPFAPFQQTMASGYYRVILSDTRRVEVHPFVVQR
jgi:phosphatidylserine/phosphatidylglycerophosphate/cardiolipin synthase-like enzyme